jgi:hypothetical protein
MTTRVITQALVVVTVIVWVAWDFWAFHRGGDPATESDVIRGWARHPLIPFVVGVLMGHLFFCECGGK